MERRKEESEAQVWEQVSRLQNELTRLNDEISSLRGRLAPVLRDRQVPGDEDGEKIPQLVPLANKLRDCVERVNVSTSEIAEITHLLEV